MMEIIECLADDGSEPLWYIAKGHHPPRVFAMALQSEYGYQVDELQRIEHAWMEERPMPDDPAVCDYFWREKGDPRAKPFTVVEY